MKKKLCPKHFEKCDAGTALALGTVTVVAAPVAISLLGFTSGGIVLQCSWCGGYFAAIGSSYAMMNFVANSFVSILALLLVEVLLFLDNGQLEIEDLQI